MEQFLFLQELPVVPLSVLPQHLEHGPILHDSLGVLRQDSSAGLGVLDELSHNHGCCTS